LWVHLFDSMVEIKHKPTSMQGILDVEQWIIFKGK
jgi:hypothetical protein